MTTITEKQADMKSVWAISSILEGVRQCHDEWAIFAPRCEPFWPSLSSIEGVMRVQTAARGITLACESQKPAVVFVPNRQLTRAIELSSTLTLSMPLVYPRIIFLRTKPTPRLLRASASTTLLELDLSQTCMQQ